MIVFDSVTIPRPNLILSSLPLPPHRFVNIMNCLLKTLSLLEYLATHSWEWSINNREMHMAELGS